MNRVIKQLRLQLVLAGRELTSDRGVPDGNRQGLGDQMESQ